MKVALVSSIYGRGNILFQSGTSLSIFLENITEVTAVDILTHEGNGNSIEFSDKIKVLGLFNYRKPASYLRVFKHLRKNRYNIVIFNSMPTSQGSSSLSNLMYEILPLYTRILLRQKTVLLYHNTPYLNDVSKLGYKNRIDQLRSLVLKIIEHFLFTRIKTLFLLRYYANKIQTIVPKTKALHLDVPYLDAFPTMRLNGKLMEESLTRKVNTIPRILLYGSWGPQKDLATTIEALSSLKKTNLKFSLTVAGGLNLHNFQDSNDQYSHLISKYSGIIDVRYGHLDEKEIMSLFLENDIIILPYKASGGFSGVLSIASFFGLSIIAPELPEIQDQAIGYEKIHFIPQDFGVSQIFDAVKEALREVGEEKNITPRSHFMNSLNEVEKAFFKF